MIVLEVLSEKILVIGSGFLGSNVSYEFNFIGNVVTQTNIKKIQKNSYELDITNERMVKICFEKIRPDIIINCAGNTDIDFLEKNPQLAYSVNGQGVRNLAIATQKFRARLIHISTDGIFDGIHGNYTEDDKPNPINVYARSKLMGEEEAIKNCENYVVIRTNFYGHHPNEKFLFNSILTNLREGKQFTGFNDVVFTPLEISNLAELISDVAFSNYNGILNLSANEPLTKYQFCFHMANILGFDPNLIKKGSIDEIGFIAQRPKNTSLNNTRSKHIIRHKIISFTDWLLKIKNSIQ